MRQRIEALALGYEELNDHDRLRLDPLHALLAGKADVLGEDRLCQEDRGKALAAHSTLNRLELGALGGDTRYQKIIAKPQEIEALLIEEAVKAIPQKSREPEAKPEIDCRRQPRRGKRSESNHLGF